MMESSHSHFFVVGDDNRIQGSISLEVLRPIMADYETVRDALIASDLMEEEVTVMNPEESLDIVMQLFGRSSLDEVPVGEQGRLVGTIRRSDVIQAYNREIFRLDMASGLASSFRLQQKMHSKQLALGEGFEIMEVAAPRIFVGKTLEVLKLRERFGATVLTIKRHSHAKGDRISYLLPTSSTIIREGDVLIVFGYQDDLSRFPRA